MGSSQLDLCLPRKTRLTDPQSSQNTCRTRLTLLVRLDYICKPTCRDATDTKPLQTVTHLRGSSNTVFECVWILERFRSLLSILIRFVLHAMLRIITRCGAVVHAADVSDSGQFVCCLLTDITVQ